MYCFKNADMITNIGGRCKSQSTNQPCTKVRNDITLQIGQYDHIKEIGSW